jgi:gamma-glutamyltranspeptidase/glutathione hydrolase
VLLPRPSSCCFVGLVLLGACARPAAAPSPTITLSAGWSAVGESRLATGRRTMVVSGHPIASRVGRDVLRDGGNAIDAAVAVGFALTVVHPEAGNIGGGGFMVMRAPDGRVRALDYRETAPAAATRDMYLGPDGEPTDKSITGHLAVGVPGAVAGMLEAHRTYGRLPLARLLAPAIALADTGFILDSVRARSIGRDARLDRFPASRAQFRRPDGSRLQAGDRLMQRDLATTLRAISERGAAGFYEGPVADLLVAEMRRGGGIITHADLKAYRALWREPITIRYRGHVIHSMPPASSGGVTLGEILNILGGYPKLPPFGSAELLHLEAEAMRRAFVDRNRWLGDPAFVQMPLDRLLSPAYADSLRRTIGPNASPTPVYDARIDRGQSTTHYSVVDADGNAVSCTTTLNNSYGAAVTVTGAGFLLNDEMDDFATAPGRPNMYGLVQGEANAIAGGKRMLSAMTPSLVFGPDGTLQLVVGTPGGPTIITQVYHVISNVIDHGMPIGAAVAAPRVHHQGLPDSLRVEGPDYFAPPVLEALRARGHALKVGGRWGDVEAIQRTPTGWVGASDPRLGGGGAGD